MKTYFDYTSTCSPGFENKHLAGTSALGLQLGVRDAKLYISALLFFSSLLSHPPLHTHIHILQRIFYFSSLIFNFRN